MKWLKSVTIVLVVLATLWLLVVISSAAFGPMSNQAAPVPPALTESQKRMAQKFGPNRGYELRVDAMKGEEFEGVNFYDVGVNWPIHGSGVQTFENRSLMGKSGPIPERVRIIWRDSAEHGVESIDGSTYNGKIVGDEIIEVGSRIPQSVIDDLKRNSTRELRLKFRMSSQGTLLGWDVEHSPGYKAGTGVWYPSAYTSVGGDFKELRPAHFMETPRGIERLPDEDYWELHPLTPELIAKGYQLRGSPKKKLIESGWYIDKKTGLKIETDF